MPEIDERLLMRDAEYFAEYMSCECCHIREYCENKASLTCEEVWFRRFKERNKNG